MGLMEDPTSGAKLVLTPHPITLDGQQYLAANLEPGEKLGGFLARVVPDWSGDCWEVRINGVVVPHEIMDRVRPKENALIEVRGVVKKQVLAIVAIAVLAYFTMGAGLAAYGAAVGVTSALGTAVLGAVTFAVGSALINKVLGPKPPSANSAAQADPVYSIGSARNSPRPYEPLPILFGSVQITPDVASMPYSWYEGKDQIMGQVFTPGVNVHSVDALYNGDTLLSSYEGVTVYTNGLPGNADQDIPLYSNADTIAGGELNENTTWVERSTPLDTVRIQINLEYLLGDSTNKGKPYPNQETVEVEYRETGGTTWLALVSRRFVNNNMDTQRATLSADVARGQYDVRVRRLGQSNPEAGHNARAQFQWVTMTAVQADDTDYTGIPRIGIRIKATGQLNGALDEIRCVAHSLPAPVWDGASWVTEQTSNPGAHLLAYARGIYDGNGRLLAGIGLPDEQIDIPALQAFMVHCTANSYTYDAYIKDIRNHTEMCDAIALAGLGQTSWAAGRFGVVWADSAQPLTGVVNMATIKKGSFQVEYTLSNASDGIEYTYVDPTTWQPVTLRVEAPGITTMQNPARITGEGVTSEAHAAKMARYHLAQHLYQYKDISFSTDLEHLTYRRLSLLALSHDMTQWGYGGRLRAAVDDTGTVTVQLDEAVPFLATPYIGLRIPGEGVYRVFTVAPFVGESDALTLVEEWPVDAAFPGDDDDNPAHDTIWIYDIKATPGYRVRVVQIEPESDLKGARVAVVPESPEFWEYVNTGAYTPPVGQSLLPSRPVATNLQVSESQTVQGDTVFTELQATFDISGTMAYATVHVAQQLDGEWGDLVQVAETRTTQARFRVPAAGAYRIAVRPYNSAGGVGGVATADYLTVGADIPPPAFDVFDVQDQSGGIRKYTWGYGVDTLQAPDFAGAEVRYITGAVPAPVWADMTPVGDDGFHTAAFEAVVPAAGEWTFAARARNTSRELSDPVVITRTLTNSLGEVIDGIETGQVEDHAAILATAADLAIAQAQLAVVQAQVGDILQADAWVLANAYPAGDLVQDSGTLYRALQAVPANTPLTDAAYWESIGNYSSLGEAVAASISIGNTNTSDIGAESTRLDAVVARLPAGAGGLASEALVAAETAARVAADSANASALTAVKAQLGSGKNLLRNAAWEVDFSGITVEYNPSGAGITVDRNIVSPDYHPQGTTTLGWFRDGTPSEIIAFGIEPVAVEAERRYCVSIYGAAHRTHGMASMQFHDAAGLFLGQVNTPSITALGGQTIAHFQRAHAFMVAPPGTATATLLFWANAATGDLPFQVYLRPMIEEATAEQTQPSPWSPSATGLDAKYAAVTQLMEAEVDSVGDIARASHTVVLDVNGNISGTRSENDGETSSFSVVADKFAIVSPAGGARTEYSAGNWRVYDASNVLRVRMGVW